MWAVVESHLEIVQLLLEQGADVNVALTNTATVTTIGGYTPLIIASKNGCLPLVNLLLSKGADKSSIMYSGETALSLASTPEIKLALE